MAQHFLFSLIRKICPMFLGGRPGICRPCSGCQGLHDQAGRKAWAWKPGWGGVCLWPPGTRSLLEVAITAA